MSINNRAFYACDEGEYLGVYYASTEVEASLLCASERGIDLEHVTCERIPWADAYKGKELPAQICLDNGWYFECGYCGREIHSESYHVDDDGNEQPDDIQCVEGWAFCSTECKVADEHKVALRERKFEEFKRAIHAARPDLEFKSLVGGRAHISMHAAFDFPGARHGGGSVVDYGDGQLKWHVANGDLDAWNAYNAEVQS